jgi:serine/threonine-protein kinase
MNSAHPTSVIRSTMPGAAAPFLVGEVIGGAYEITALLGIGGMGAVYEAHDASLSRHVAIKAALEARFGAAIRNEARALAALRHPSLLTVFGAGRERDVDYMVAELVRGETLERLIDETVRAGAEIPIDEVIDLLLAITDGLCALHAAGMAHRDLKPGNVILGGARVVLIDLGLFVPEFEVSEENLVAGSPEYVAPEVLLRMVEPGGGPLIDLYALGIIAYEMLTGRSPFYDDDASKIMSRHVFGELADVRTVRADVPPKLAALVAELTTKDAGERPPSSEAVLWQLSALRGQNVAAPGDMRVLVVDDDPDVGAVLAKALEAWLPGITVERTTDPNHALASIERSAPDVAAIDLNMPGMNGIELCGCIDALPPARRPAIVAMSAEVTARDADVLRALGAVQIVAKDYRFVATVCDVVRAIRQAREEAPRSVRPPMTRRR